MFKEIFTKSITEAKKIYKVTYFSDENEENDIGSIYVYAKNDREAEKKTEDEFKVGSWLSRYSSEMDKDEIAEWGITPDRIKK